jgi:hypothetical protein
MLMIRDRGKVLRRLYSIQKQMIAWEEENVQNTP